MVRTAAALVSDDYGAVYHQLHEAHQRLGFAQYLTLKRAWAVGTWTGLPPRVKRVTNRLDVCPIHDPSAALAGSQNDCFG